MNSSLKDNLKYGFGSPGETAAKISEQYLYHTKLGKTEEVACSLVLNNYIETFEMIGVDIEDETKHFLRSSHQNNPAIITFLLTMISAGHSDQLDQYEIHFDLILEVITEVHNETLNQNNTASELQTSLEEILEGNG